MRQIERTSTGASELERMARRCTNFTNAGSAWQLICSADINAADTCKEHGITAKSENYDAFYSDMFWGSLETLLSCEPIPHYIKKWFAVRGVRW